MTPKYENRLVFFVDFLGFKEVVADTVTDKAGLAHLIRALRCFDWIDESRMIRSQCVTQFSDSIVISCLVTDKSAVMSLLNAMLLSNIDIVNSGYLIRGAVTYGKLYHTAKHVVGPAMVKAYEMESKEAIYPRVIVDRSVIGIGQRYHADHHSGFDEGRYIRSVLSTDTDHKLYLDYVSDKVITNATGFDHLSRLQYLGAISRILEKGLRHRSDAVVEKYEWLLGHYRCALDNYSEPALTASREDKEFFDAVSELPRFPKHIPVS